MSKISVNDEWVPRPLRRAFTGIPLHVVQRGNNRQAVFFHYSEYGYCLDKPFDSNQ